MKKIGFIIYLSITVIIAGWFTFIGVKSLGNPIEEEERTRVSKDYKSISPPAMSELEDILWDAPKAQDPEGFWLYEVFTPPKIYLEEGKWVAKPPVPPVPPPPPVDPNPLPPFGLELKSIYRPPFRVVVESVIYSGLDPAKSYVQLEYLNIAPPAPGMSQATIISREPLRGNVGVYTKEFQEKKIRPLNLKPEQITRNNLPVIVYKVQIQDFTAINPQTGDVFTFELINDKKAVPGPDFWVTLSSTENPSLPPIFLKNPKPGHQFVVNKDKFTIEKISEVPPAITVKKVFQYREFDDQPWEEREETKGLGITPIAPASPPAQPAPIPGSLPSVPSPTPTLPPPAGTLPIPGSIPTPRAAPVPLPTPSSGQVPFPGATPVPRTPVPR